MDAALAAFRRDLAGPDLALTDLFAAGQRVRAQAAAWQAAPDLPASRIAVLGGLTLDYLGAAIGSAAVQEGRPRSCTWPPTAPGCRRCWTRNRACTASAPTWWCS